MLAQASCSFCTTAHLPYRLLDVLFLAHMYSGLEVAYLYPFRRYMDECQNLHLSKVECFAYCIAERVGVRQF